MQGSSLAPYSAHHTIINPQSIIMEGPVEKKSRTDEVENIAAVLYGVDDLRIVI